MEEEIIPDEEYVPGKTKRMIPEFVENFTCGHCPYLHFHRCTNSDSRHYSEKMNRTPLPLEVLFRGCPEIPIEDREFPENIDNYLPGDSFLLKKLGYEGKQPDSDVFAINTHIALKNKRGNIRNVEEISEFE